MRELSAVNLCYLINEASDAFMYVGYDGKKPPFYAGCPTIASQTAMMRRNMNAICTVERKFKLRTPN